MQSPTMPMGVSIFKEIGLGRMAEKTPTNELSQVYDALRSGDSKGLVQARNILDRLVQKRVEDVSPAGATKMPDLKVSAPAAPAQAAAPAAPPAPAGPTAGGKEPQGQNLMSDIAKVIKAAGEATGSIQKPTTTGAPSGQAQPPGAGAAARAAVPGRRPM